MCRQEGAFDGLEGWAVKEISDREYLIFFSSPGFAYRSRCARLSRECVVFVVRDVRLWSQGTLFDTAVVGLIS